MNFEQLGIKAELAKELKSLGFSSPSEVQSKVIPIVLKDKNVCVKSPTGSGKTHTYLLPILNKINPDINKTQALILSPTRELAKQIFMFAKPLADSLNISIKLLSSGSDRNKDKESLESSSYQIIIGTPGRIVDLAFNNALFNITTASYLVMDEADMILEEGFLDQVGVILSKLKQNILFMAFSASLPKSLITFLDKYVNDLQYIDLSKNLITSSSVKHIMYPTRNRDRLETLKTLIDAINPYIVLVFASRKEKVEEIYKYLSNNKYRCCMIHGDLSSTIRRTTMKRIQNNEFSIIVASDIAARGIDIEGVSEVINYDLPYEIDFYYHRAGRTGRFNKIGTCYSLYDKEEVDKFRVLYEKGIKFKNIEYKDGKWVELKNLFEVRKNNKNNPLNDQIREIVNKNKNKKVKPNYKKKQKYQIEQIKKKHRREIIKNDIKRQRIERYKEISRNKEREN